MSDGAAFSLSSDLRGLAVLDGATSDEIGVVEDVFVRPEDGRLVCLAFLSRGGERLVVPCGDFRLGRGSVTAVGWAAFRSEAAGGISARGELTGASVVTEGGRLLGYVRDVLVTPGDSRVEYMVGRPGRYGPLNRPVPVGGDAAISFSRSGKRLIVSSRAAAQASADDAGRARRLLERAARLRLAARGVATEHGVAIWLLTMLTLLGAMLWL